MASRDQPLHERAGQPGLPGMRVAVDQHVHAPRRDRDRLAGGPAPAEGDPVARRLGRGKPTGKDRIADRQPDAGPRPAGQGPVGPLPDGGDAVGGTRAEATRVEQRQVVLRVAQGQHVMGRELHEAQDLFDARAFRYAGGQQHDRRPVRDQVAGHPGRTQGVPHGALVGTGDSDDDSSHLVGGTATPVPGSTRDHAHRFASRTSDPVEVIHHPRRSRRRRGRPSRRSSG